MNIANYIADPNKQVVSEFVKAKMREAFNKLTERGAWNEPDALFNALMEPDK